MSPKLCYLDPNSNRTSGFVVKNSEKCLNFETTDLGETALETVGAIVHTKLSRFLHKPRAPKVKGNNEFVGGPHWLI